MLDGNVIACTSQNCWSWVKIVVLSKQISCLLSKWLLNYYRKVGILLLKIMVHHNLCQEEQRRVCLEWDKFGEDTFSESYTIDSRDKVPYQLENTPLRTIIVHIMAFFPSQYITQKTCKASIIKMQHLNCKCGRPSPLPGSLVNRSKKSP